LSNLVLLDADVKISATASKDGCFFTRFVDDLGLSGDKPQELIPFVARVLQGAGFRISRKKLKLMPASSRQEMTGLLANSKSGARVPRYKIDQIRAAIHQLQHLPRNSGFDRAVRSIKGRIAHVSRTNPRNSARLCEYLELMLS
jgi:hypothetical protein